MEKGYSLQGMMLEKLGIYYMKKDEIWPLSKTIYTKTELKMD